MAGTAPRPVAALASSQARRLLAVAAVVLILAGIIAATTHEPDDRAELSADPDDDHVELSIIPPSTEAPTTTIGPDTTAPSDVGVPVPPSGPPPTARSPAITNPSPGPPRAGVVRIGQIGSFSGHQPSFFNSVIGEADDALLAWADDVNRNGGLGGNLVELVVADDQGDADRRDDLARTMVEEFGVRAFVGDLSIADGRLQPSVPLVGGALVDPVRTGAALVRLAVAGGAQRIAVVLCHGPEVCETTHEAVLDAAGAAGVEIAFSAPTELTEVDYGPVCQELGVQEVDLAIALELSTGVALLQQCGQPVVTWPFGATDVGSGDGMAAALPAFPWMATDTPAAVSFANAVGDQNGPAGAFTWAAGRLLERAVAIGIAEGAGSFEGAIAAGMPEANADTLGGLLPPAGCTFVIAGSAGGWTAPQGSVPLC